MQITKCDICKKKIKEEWPISVTIDGWKRKELCNKCGAPILRFLKKNKLTEKEKKKQERY